MTATLTQLAADCLDIALTPEQERQFETYARELADWNERVNLTAITDEEGIRVRHFLDSLTVTCVLSLQPGMRIIDVGTGAGFPGLPLLIAFPDIQVTLLEATGKKISFLDHLIQSYGLTGASTLHARAEEAGHLPEHRARYDVVVARAVARLPALVEYLLPLARIGGVCVAMKGVSAADEARDAEAALKVLGGRLRDITEIQLPGVSQPHYLVVFSKESATPSAYPRKPGTPTRKPLI
jgi:16S rRNA (guanine527-N7)-methyltransferase